MNTYEKLSLRFQPIERALRKRPEAQSELDGLVQQTANEFDQAALRERELCAKDVCPMCLEGLRRETHSNGREIHIDGSVEVRCQANAIWSRVQKLKFCPAGFPEAVQRAMKEMNK